MLKDKTVFHEKIQRFLYNGKMVKEVFGAWEHTKNESCKTVARKIMSMSECKHYTQTEKNTHIYAYKKVNMYLLVSHQKFRQDDMLDISIQGNFS